ncbi:unnamed protein product [Bemisia tabaci]|uniref:Uncharacterized protein n=1 Tax=Bemisia tabaci TaxID=7038 RepID=A0A9P0F098_BEMTA|nr:unnamed protein product [Bemisia tabaci]
MKMGRFLTPTATALLLMAIFGLSNCWELDIWTENRYGGDHTTLSGDSSSCRDLHGHFDNNVSSLKVKSGGVNGYLDHGCKIFALVFTEGGTYDDFSNREFNNLISSFGYGSN